MTEGNTVYRSCGYQEDQSYGDTSISGHHKYKMNSFAKRQKLGRLLRILLYVIGFLLIVVSCIVFGLLLHPNLAQYCQKQNFSEQRKSDSTGDYHYTSTLESILSSMKICKRPYDNTSTQRVRLNTNKIESFLEKVGNTSLYSNACICPNSTKEIDSIGNYIKEENGTFEFGDKCLCNKSGEAIVVKQTYDIQNEHKKYDNEVLNNNETVSSNDFYVNETDYRHHLQSNICNCANASKMNNLNPNVSESEIHDIDFEESSNCKCPEVNESNIEVNETTNTSEKDDYNSLAIKNCRCSPAYEGRNDTVNGSEYDSETFDVKFRNNTCNCSDIQYIYDFNTDKRINETRTYIVESSNTGDANDFANFHFNDTGLENETGSLMNDNCICPKSRNMTYVLFNGTEVRNEVHDIELDEDNTCKCGDLKENINFDHNKTIFETEKSDINNHIETEDCVCSEISQLEKSESINKTNKLGIKTAEGKCFCGEMLGDNGFKTNNTTTGNTKNYDESLQTDAIYFNETENVAENVHEYSNKCLCSKTDDIVNGTRTSSEDTDCICPDLVLLQEENFELYEKKSERNKSEVHSLKPEECICLETHKLDNASKIESKNLGFRALNGTCMCSGTNDLNYMQNNENAKHLDDDSKKKTVIFKNLTNDQGSKTANETDLMIDHELKTFNADKLFDNDGKERVSKTVLSNGHNKENSNKKQLANGHKKRL